MINLGKKNIGGVLINALDYEAAVEAVRRAAKEGRSFSVSTAAVHAVMEGALNREHKFRLNHLDMITPDGQPVRWALNLLYATRLPDRVYGPHLTLELCAMAEREDLGVFFYGNTSEVLAELRRNLEMRFPRLSISGMLPSQFRQISQDERNQIAKQIIGTGASLLFIGLGCPRQDVWIYEYREILPIPMVAVGGAFGVIAGKVPQAPEWMQERGLEWVFRFYCEPKRLWRRYVLLNPAYVCIVLAQAARLMRFKTDGSPPQTELRYG